MYILMASSGSYADKTVTAVAALAIEDDVKRAVELLSKIVAPVKEAYRRWDRVTPGNNSAEFEALQRAKNEAYAKVYDLLPGLRDSPGDNDFYVDEDSKFWYVSLPLIEKLPDQP